MTSPHAPLREQMKQVEKAISADQRRHATNALADVGADFLASTGPKTIAGFFPTGHQITPLLLMNALHLRQLSLALPKRCEDHGVVFHKWSPGAKMATGDRNIPVPADCENQVEPDYLLVPVLGFDRMGNRLGYGDGFYDQAISTLRSKKPIMVVGVGFAEQELSSLIEGESDGRLDWILTPQGLHGFTQ